MGKAPSLPLAKKNYSNTKKNQKNNGKKTIRKGEINLKRYCKGMNGLLCA